ncbi:MAG: sugar-specific transcriptional regulator TrmB [Candidatus Azotimanducaceae bacterium]
MRNKVASIVNQAQGSVLISHWAEELSWIKDDLKKAASRGLNVAMVHFGKASEQIGATYYHPIEKCYIKKRAVKDSPLLRTKKSS